MKRKLLSILIIITISLLTITPVFAQSYSFGVDTANVDAYFNKDGTLTLEYEYVFHNQPGASPIDFVDVGLPSSNYDLKSVTAWIDGNPITDIQKADPQNLTAGDSGVTLALGSSAIQSGQTGDVKLHVGVIRKVLYPYSSGDIKDYVSVNVIPNWFSGNFVTGTTKYTVTLHLPPGIQQNEPIYYKPDSNWPGTADPTSGYDNEGNVFYQWSADNASVASKYTFGAGFPSKYIPSNTIVTAPAITFDPGMLICWCIVLIALLVFGFSIYQAIWGAKKRKLQYLPPKIAIEGHGIKRGLTAVEAAVLMEQPVDKVLTMILFGVIKKNAATVLTRDPLEVKATDPLPEGLQPYESEFLASFKLDKIARKRAMQELFVNLVKTVGEKMKGFSRKETVDYYKDINEKAWQQITAADTPEVKGQKLDENLEWTMLDKDFTGRTQQSFGSIPVFLPMWWGRYDPSFGHTAAASVPSVGSLGGSGSHTTTVSLPHLPGSDFAASMVGGVQAFSAGVIGDLNSFTSSITNRTNPVPPPSTSTWRSGGGGLSGGGGHSCACACACAGCACACAGGGR